jgi:hypothetical protein
MRTIFEVDDGTASFKLIFYQKGENDVPYALRTLEFTEGMYARIYGSLRVFKEDRALVGSNIQAITNHNEVTNHFLKIFTAHCIRKHGNLTNQDLSGGNQAMGAMSKGMQSNQVSGMDSQQMILNVMRELKRHNGSQFVNKNDVWTSCQAKMSKTDFDSQIKNLEDEGSIYQAGSADTFCLTDD